MLFFTDTVWLDHREMLACLIGGESGLAAADTVRRSVSPRSSGRCVLSDHSSAQAHANGWRDLIKVPPAKSVVLGNLDDRRERSLFVDAGNFNRGNAYGVSW